MAVTQPSLAGIDTAAPAKSKRKGDHKRVARPIAPAIVIVSPMGDDIIIRVPDVLGKNEAHKQPGFGRKGKVISKATQNYRASVRHGAWEYAEKFCPGPTIAVTANGVDSATCMMPWTKAHAGAWRLEVIGVWPNENHGVGFKAPRGDADAAIPQALDALQHAGILDDDARVIEVRAWNLYRKGERWTVIRLVRVPDLAERDAAIAHLVAALPPPSAPVPVATKRRKR